MPGLCQAATLKEIEAQGWSLNPGRYVGVAPGEAVSDEDFKEQLETLNEELETLNAQARDLEQTIAAQRGGDSGGVTMAGLRRWQTAQNQPTCDGLRSTACDHGEHVGPIADMNIPTSGIRILTSQTIDAGKLDLTDMQFDHAELPPRRCDSSLHRLATCCVATALIGKMLRRPMDAV